MAAKDEAAKEDPEGVEPPSGPAATAMQEAAAQVDSERLQGELSETHRRVNELLDKLKYLQADFENYRKRAERERRDVARHATEELLANLLPVLDDFDRCVEGLPDDEAGRGVRMIHETILRVLREAGLEEIPGLGEPFDPWVHEVVGPAKDGDAPPGTVAEVVQKGYRLRDRVLRPAKVIVTEAKGEDDG
jgi:molecular chaperone GrpE